MSKVDEMVDVLRNWQHLERVAMNDTAEVMETTKSPLIRLLMEIIRHDSLMHHRVQQFLVDSVVTKSVPVTREDIGEIWAKIEAHDKVEKKTIAMAEQLKKKSWDPVHTMLLDYLLRDEGKHDSLIEQLDGLKSGLTKASGA